MCFLSYTDNIFFYTHLTCGVLSCLGSLAIIICYLLQDKTKFLLYHLVLNLTVAQLLGAVEFLVPVSVENTNYSVCAFFAILSNSAQLISVVWMTYIAINIYQVVAGKPIFFEKCRIFWTVLAWVGVPLLNCVPLATESYALIGKTCSYDFKLEGSIERIFIYYVPAWVLLIVTVGCYYKIFILISEFELGSNYKTILKRLMLYPFVMGVNIILLTFMRVSSYFLGTCAETVAEYFFYIIIGLNGFFNFIIFLSTPGNLDFFYRRRKEFHTFEDCSEEFTTIIND